MQPFKVSITHTIRDMPLRYDNIKYTTWISKNKKYI